MDNDHTPVWMSLSSENEEPSNDEELAKNEELAEDEKSQD